ncbi:4'-phosphopantetheinyl transferase superfamily protein [Streptomyces sp. DSM 42041]|uniref:4'-phosphopantetheinyl transferase superfamily protein n=1 Tax=Streptomyces hazeniae TaxID=3075538 RepID=A0ABU2NS27_9ACTN|nr:4'-phosphopantetheinyl transferase superfamily protein [Streptomyces sp. DSM 42041]MDT0378438.1 4'-phosphopantetheinyl transferase superfamily protein [Streptomyces sp. DSM 42041]
MTGPATDGTRPPGAAGTTAPGSAFPPPSTYLPAPRGPWTQLLHDLHTTGTGLVHAYLSEWRSELLEGRERRALLGRDMERYEKLATAQLRERFLATRMLIRYTAAVALGAEPAALELRYGLNGRVHLRGHDQIDVSLSHTADLLLCGITSLGVIGVDTEPAGRKLSSPDVERLMCTEPERERLARTAQPDRDRVLLHLWTLKEAYSKALGQGLRFPFTEFGFRLDDEGTARLERSDGTLVRDGTWRFGTRIVPGGHLAALALQDTRRSEPPDTRAGTAVNRQILAAITGASSSG